MRSIIPAEIIDNMESNAYTYAASKWTGFTSTDSKIHMSELFQLVAGTSSGSIVAAGVSYGSGGKPTMWGKDIVNFFAKNGKNLFEKHSLEWGLHLFFWITIALAFACVGYWLGRRRYDSPRQTNAFENLKMIISNSKRQAKRKPEKYKFDKLLSVGDKDYGKNNREPLLK